MTDETKPDNPRRKKPYHSTKKKDGTPIASTRSPKRTVIVNEVVAWRAELRKDRIKFDDEAKRIFLEEFAKRNLLTYSAKAAGVCTNTVHAHYEHDPEFKEAYDLCIKKYRDTFINHAQNLMLEGSKKPIIGGEFRDEVVAYETIYPTNLIAMEMRKVDPGYKERQEIDHKGTAGGVLVVPAGMTAADFVKQYGSEIDKPKES